MNKEQFEQMLNYFDEEKIEDKYADDEDVTMWASGGCKASTPYYKYCNSQWRARVHRQKEYDIYMENKHLKKETKKLDKQVNSLLTEQYRLKKQIAALINSKNRLELETKKLKN